MENQAIFAAKLHATITDNFKQIGTVTDSGSLIVNSGNTTLIDVSIDAMIEDQSQAIANLYA